MMKYASISTQLVLALAQEEDCLAAQALRATMAASAINCRKRPAPAADGRPKKGVLQERNVRRFHLRGTVEYIYSTALVYHQM